MAAAVEIARAVSGLDPLNRYPKEDGICYCVGKDGREVAQVMYKLLFKPGAFKMIRDNVTDDWRVYDPMNPEDLHREYEARPALPLIPKRHIETISWELKKDGLPKMIVLKNGWQIHFYSSNGSPTHGSSIDLAWFDEEIQLADWYSEVAARLVDRKGRFIWSATPQAGTEKLYALHERAEALKDKGVKHPVIEEFFCTIDGNRYMTDQQRNIFVEKFEDDEMNMRVRRYGEFAILSGRVYPEYSPELHNVEPFEIPREWTRYVSIDPGRQVCAVLFLAVPPPSKEDSVYLYDELYLKACSAVTLAKEMQKKQVGQEFRAFLIDMMGASSHDIGSGKKIVEQYAEQFAAHNVKSIATGHNFLAGNSNVRAGTEQVRFWLRWREDNTTKLKIFTTLVNLIKEFKHYRYKKIKDRNDNRFTDEPERKHNHLLDCLRYLAQYRPTWHPPQEALKAMGKVYRRFLKEQEKESKHEMLMLGPGNYARG